MLQYSLLLVEALLLGATAYLYWNTRKLAENPDTPTPLPQPGWVQNQVTVSQMAQDVAQLVTELQTVAGATRDDLLRQRTELQQMLQQAETLTTELRELTNQAEAGSLPQLLQEAAVLGQSAGPSTTPKSVTEPAYSPVRFGQFLRISGCGQDVVTLASEHAQEFMLWFDQQLENNEPAPAHIEPRYLDQYIEYLEAHRVDPDTIKRRFIALKAYLNWVNNLSQVDSSELDEPEPVAVESAATAGTGGEALLSPREPEPPLIEEQIHAGLERYRTVFSLAEEGLDQLGIAAKTGLEQEAVRMLLLMGRSAYASPVRPKI